MSASAQCEAYINLLEKRLQAGITAAAVEFTDQMFESLNEVKAVLDPEGYKGSGPGDPPAVFERWFTENLDLESEHLEANIGFTHEHAAAVYRLLVAGTEHIEPRAGPEELYKQVKNLMVLSFGEAFCAKVPQGNQDDEVPF